jgi:F0F1-type ATP synthase assembly protein I
MGKKAKSKPAKSGNTVQVDPVQKSLDSALNARRMFVVSTLNMGWQLAGMVIIPVLVGVKLDLKFDSKPSYTLAALVIAIFGSIIVIKNNINRVNKEMSQTNREDNNAPK